MSDRSAAAPIADLGAYLTGTEALGLARRIGDGATLTGALAAIGPERRLQARELFMRSGLSVDDRDRAVAVLTAIVGAHRQTRDVTTVWTTPGHVVRSGQLTGRAADLVQGAKQSITCSTFNFQRSSGLWTALREAAGRPGVLVRVYVDTVAAQGGRAPSVAEVAAHLHPAVVLRTGSFAGAVVRNHAKFVAVDHRFLLVTSANFSASAELHNVELGLLLDDVAVTESVEREMRRAEDAFYQVVSGDPG